eukprot:08756.XXX_243385_243014_1 [CDS] Oithona nana genome sequencing.
MIVIYLIVSLTSSLEISAQTPTAPIPKCCQPWHPKGFCPSGEHCYPIPQPQTPDCLGYCIPMEPTCRPGKKCGLTCCEDGQVCKSNMFCQEKGFYDSSSSSSSSEE